MNERPRRLSESLDQVTRHLGAPRSTAMAQLFRGWNDIAGEVIGAHTKPLSLVRGVLLVEAETAVWASELRYFTGTLLTKIEAAVGPGVAERIEVRVARPPGSRESAKKGL